jgi:hypothetical protein
MFLVVVNYFSITFFKTQSHSLYLYDLLIKTKVKKILTIKFEYIEASYSVLISSDISNTLKDHAYHNHHRIF